MITQIDTQPWSKELVTGNAQFIELGNTIYIVSQVRADNTFAVFKSVPTPPTPGPGYAFTAVATYTFPNPNTSFDPVIAYDGSQYIYIVGTQDDGKFSDVILFSFDTLANVLSSPTTLATASYIRDCYDICALGENQFVAVALTNPTQVWQTPTVAQVTALSITGGVITATAENSYSTGKQVTFSGLQLAGFLNNVTATIISAASGQFTADDLVASEFWTVPAAFPYLITVNNAGEFLADSKVIYTASSGPLLNVTAHNQFSLTAVNVAVNGTTTYVGTFPSTLPSGTASISGFTNSSNNGVFTVVSNTTTHLVVANANGLNEINTGSVALLNKGQYVESAGVYQFNPQDAGTKVSIAYSYSPADYTQPSGQYESGFVTWLPGHSLLGFELDMVASLQSPPTNPFVSVTLLDSSPSRTGNTFGAVSAYSPDGLSIEVYYESHPKQVTFADQYFNVNLATFTASPPGWNLPSTILKTFSGRFADSRLTVIPQGTTRTLLQQYYSQLVQQNSLVGNILLGHCDLAGSPPAWNFLIQPGSSSASYIQGTLSVSPTQTFVSYLAEPTYDLRGAWSPAVKHYDTDDRLSYNKIDYGVIENIIYPYRGAWTSGTSYKAGDVTLVGSVYYTANVAIPVALVAPNLDTNWSLTLTPDVDTAHFAPAPIAWPLRTNILDVDTLSMTGTSGFFNTLNFSWLRGSKMAMDSLSKWGVVGEVVGETTGATYVSAYDVPPIVKLVPNNSAIAWRGTPLVLNASGTTDGDEDSIEYTWTLTPANADVTLTPNGNTASLLVSRTIGGDPQQFIVGVAAVDYNGVTPLHPPMNIVSIEFESGVLTALADAPVSLAVGEQVFLYNLTVATWLNDLQVTVTAVSGNSFSATVNNIPKTEYWTVPTSSPYTVTVLNSSTFVANTSVVYAATGNPLTIPVPVALTGVAASVSGKTTYSGTFPTNSLTGARATVAGFSNSANNGNFLVVSNTANTLVVVNSSAVAETNPSATVSIFGAGNYTVSGSTYTFNRLDVGKAMLVSYTYAFEQPAYQLSGASSNSGATTYFGSFPTGSMAGLPVTIVGFNESVNNGTFTITSSTTNGIVVSNTGFTETYPALAYAGYPASADTGNAIANQQFAFCDVSVAANAAPTIDFTHDRLTGLPVSLPIQAARNSTVTINPTYTGVNDPDDATTYTWAQTLGTPVPSIQILSGLGAPSLQFETNGLLVQGETLNWSLVVNDGVNSTASGFVTVDVAAYPFDYPDTLRLSRSVWGGTISQRNTVQSWAPLDVSVVFTNLQNIKRSSVLDGSDRYILISDGSVTVYGGINPSLRLLRRLFVPVNNTLSPPISNPIVDAVHTEDDWTLVLDSAGNLYRFSSAPFINTDNSDITLSLSKITTMSFNKVFLTVSYNDSRVVVLTGQDGCLLLQINNSNLAVQGFLELTTGSELLYGVDNVQFVRVSNVESLNTGKLLLGTIAQVQAAITSIGVSNNAVTVVADNTFSNGTVITFADLTQATFLNGVTTSVVSATPFQFVVSYLYGDYAVTSEGVGAIATAGGKTFETLIDLSHGQIIGTWDASKLRNQFVTTGEILFEVNDTYAGQPTAPALSPVTIGVSPASGYVSLSVTWVANRPDLVQSYELNASFDPAFASYTTTIVNGGYNQAAIVIEPINQIFYFRVRANSADGISPYSNIQSINTSASGSSSSSTGFCVSFGEGFGST